MANVTGVRTTTNIEQKRRVIDMADQIALLDPNVAPLITILKKIKGGKNTRVAYSPKFEWLEDDYLSYKDVLGTGGWAYSSPTSAVVGSVGLYRVGDVIYLPTVGKSLLVTAITAATSTLTLALIDSAAGTTSASAGDAVIILGNASAENSSMREAISTQEVAKFNYTQIFRTPCAMSGTEMHSKLYGGKDQAYQRRKILAEHKMDIARSMYFGVRKEDTSGATPRRTMGGIFETLKASSNKQAFVSGTTNFTWNKFNELVAAKAFMHGSEEKLMICGGTTAAAIDAWDINALQTEIKGDTFGVHVKRLVTSYGVLDLVWDRTLDRCGCGDYGIILDMDNVRYTYLEGRDTKLYTNIQANDVDGVVDEYRTECSLELKLPETHFLITGAYVPTGTQMNA